MQKLCGVIYTVKSAQWCPWHREISSVVSLTQRSQAQWCPWHREISSVGSWTRWNQLSGVLDTAWNQLSGVLGTVKSAQWGPWHREISSAVSLTPWNQLSGVNDIGDPISFLEFFKGFSSMKRGSFMKFLSCLLMIQTHSGPMFHVQKYVYI